MFDQGEEGRGHREPPKRDGALRIWTPLRLLGREAVDLAGA